MFAKIQVIIYYHLNPIKKPKDSERDIQNYNYTCRFICMSKLCISHSKGRIKLENIQGQSPEEETVLRG